MVEVHSAVLPSKKLHMTLALLGKVTAAAAPSRGWQDKKKDSIFYKSISYLQEAGHISASETFTMSGQISLTDDIRTEACFAFWSQRTVTLQLFPLKRFYSNSSMTSLKTCSFCNSLVS